MVPDVLEAWNIEFLRSLVVIESVREVGNLKSTQVLKTHQLIRTVLFSYCMTVPSSCVSRGT